MVKRPAARLSLKLLGGFELRGPPGADLRLPTRNAKALFAYVAVHAGQPQSREKLMALLWGERSDRQARHSLNQTLVYLRKAVAGAGEKVLDSDRQSITFVPGSIDVDVLSFRRLVGERPSEAVALYAGPFLDGIGVREPAFEDWLSAQRAELHGLACEALKRQCARNVEQGRQADAIEVGRRLVALDPLSEEAHRQLMRLYHEAGDRTSALKQFRYCAEILERDLDVRPAIETRRLLEEIKRGDIGREAENGRDDPRRLFGGGVPGPAATGDKPSIAVLPFVNMSGDADQEYFSDGITEDIITELSRYPDFLVIARNSTFVYRNKAVDHKRIAQDLGVQFVLEGSVRRAGKRVRISAQLIDVSSGSHLWAEHYDRTLKDIFVVQDEITGAIVGSLGQALQDVHRRRAERKDPSSLDAYDKTLQASAHFNRFSKDDNLEARRLAEAAIALDAGYARAHAIVAWTYLMDFSSLWSEDPDESLRQSHEVARKAVALDDHNCYAHLALGASEEWLGRHEQAIADMRRAIELNPSDADSHAYFANLLVFAGRAEDALDELETAMRLNPHYPGWYLQFAGRAYFTQRRYREAERAFERVVTVNPGWPWAHLILAATRAALGKTEDAKAEVAAARRISPNLTLAHAPKAWRFKNPADLEHVVDMLRKAGMP